MDDATLILSIKGLGLKITPKRLEILRILSEELYYLSPEDIWKRMQSKFKSIGLPTVYRNLEELSRGGVIYKVIHPDRRLYYFYCPNKGHHHHFVCIACRRVEDINFCEVDKISNEIEMVLKGRVLSHILQVFGLCRVCSNSSLISG